jgi:hypothetical protein
VSFKFFWELAKSKAADAGIMIVPGYEYFDEANEDQKNPWWKNVVPSVSTSCGFITSMLIVNDLVPIP